MNGDGRADDPSVPLPADAGGDPIRSDRPEELRGEILRLRRELAESAAEIGALRGQVAEISGSLHQCEGLGAAYDQLAAQYEQLSSRLPLRIARRIRHGFRSRSAP